MGGPIFLENPDTSLLWLAPRMRSLTRVAVFAQARFHQCQFGTLWKKCTRIVAWRGGCLSKLKRWCHSDGKRCSRTGLPHQELAGRALGGRLILRPPDAPTVSAWPFHRFLISSWDQPSATSRRVGQFLENLKPTRDGERR